MKKNHVKILLVYAVLGAIFIAGLLLSRQLLGVRPLLPTGRFVVAVEGNGLSSPDWSPDGTGIIVRNQAYWNQWEPASLAYVDVQSGKSRTLAVTSIAGRDEPHWTADGSAVLVTGSCVLSSVSWPEGDEQALGSACIAAPSPDGRRMAVQFSPGQPPAIKVAVRELEETTKAVAIPDRIIFEDGASPVLGEIAGIDWSASNWIAFSYCPHCQGESDTFDIFVIDPNGKSVSQLDVFQANETDPSWSVDGNWLAFLVQRSAALDSERTVALASRNGMCVKEFITARGISGVDWGPTNDELAITVSNQLWIVSLTEMLGITYDELTTKCP